MKTFTAKQMEQERENLEWQDAFEKAMGHHDDPFKVADGIIENTVASKAKVLSALRRLGNNAYCDGRGYIFQSEIFRNAPHYLRADKEVVLEALRTEGSEALRYASEDLRSDKEVVVAAVCVCGAMAIRYASSELRSDREIVLQAVKHNDTSHSIDYLLGIWETCLVEQRENFSSKYVALEWASEEWKADREIVKESVKRNGFALMSASEELRGDREIVMQATQEHPLALAYASDELRADRKIVNKSVEARGEALKYASDELQADREIVMKAVAHRGHRGHCLQYASKELQADKELVLLAVKNIGWNLNHASENLRADRDVVLQALKCDWGWCDIKCVGKEELGNDPVLVATAIGTNIEVGEIFYSFIGEKLKVRLRNAVTFLQKEQQQQQPEAAAAALFADKLKQRLWHTIWLLDQAFFESSSSFSSQPPGCRQIILEYLNVVDQFKHANNLAHCAPVIVALEARVGSRWEYWATA